MSDNLDIHSANNEDDPSANKATCLDGFPREHISNPVYDIDDGFMSKLFDKFADFIRHIAR